VAEIRCAYVVREHGASEKVNYVFEVTGFVFAVEIVAGEEREIAV